MPGREFSRELTLPHPPDRAVAELTTTMARLGYSPALQAESYLTFTRRYSPGIFIVLYILLFPIGLLFLLARPTQTVTVRYQAASGGTWIGVGTDDVRVARLFDDVAERTAA